MFLTMSRLHLKSFLPEHWKIYRCASLTTPIQEAQEIEGIRLIRLFKQPTETFLQSNNPVMPYHTESEHNIFLVIQLIFQRRRLSFTTYLNHVSLSGLHLEMNMNKIGQFGLGGSQCGTSDGQSCRNPLHGQKMCMPCLWLSSGQTWNLILAGYSIQFCICNVCHVCRGKCEIKILPVQLISDLILAPVLLAYVAIVWLASHVWDT